MFSKIVRRTHMYLALFLVPWMLVYALATMAMNHRDFLREHYGGELREWETEDERLYEKTFPANASPQKIGGQILADLGFNGPYEAQARNDGSLRLWRSDPLAPRQITYTPESGKLVTEKMVFRMPMFLTMLHHRYGYGTEHVANDLWAVSVDLAVFAMVFWVASGLWMWWEMKPTRRWGAVFLATGFGIFAFFLLTI